MGSTAVLDARLSAMGKATSGKVRDIFDLGNNLLMVSTDRISAFDFVLPVGIPDKGKVLTMLSVHWFELTSGIVPNHLISVDVGDFPEAVQQNRDILAGRSMLVKKAEMFPVECVVRGYLAGSGYKEYKASGSVCGVKLPPGLQMADRLPELIFTPATKATDGHDENIPFEKMVEIVGREDAEKLREISLEVFRKASEHAEKSGIIIADTKFEFGRLPDEPGAPIILCDEVLTPDSSRFWDKDTYKPGSSPPSFDKQFVRDYLESIHWNKQPPIPDLPDEIVQGTRQKYLDIYQRLTGSPLAL